MIMNFELSGMVMIGNAGYMIDLLQDYVTATSLSTPADENLFTIRESPLLSTSHEKRFDSFETKLLYLSNRTRPGILKLVAPLTTRVQSPTEDDQAKLHRGLEHLARTVDLFLTLEVKDPTVPI